VTDPVGVALIGAGMWGPRIAAAASRAPGIKLVTCFSRGPERREKVAADQGIEAAESFETAVEHPDVEGVLLVTPNDLHAQQALACADRGKHVFVEKPIADTVEAGAEMRDRFQADGLVLSVGHAFRRFGAARRVKGLLDEAALGTVVLAEANFSLPGKLVPEAWRWYRERAPGGPLLQLGIHHADTLRYWLGPVTESRGLFARLVTEAEIDDVGAVSLRFESGAVGVITGSYVSPHTFFLRLYGTLAVLEYRVDMSVWPNAELVDGATTLSLIKSDEVEEVSFDPRDPLAEELDEFGHAVHGETVPETGAAEGIAALDVILGAVSESTA
jgi:predicted dehydrogenase